MDPITLTVAVTASGVAAVVSLVSTLTTLIKARRESTTSQAALEQPPQLKLKDVEGTPESSETDPTTL